MNLAINLIGTSVFFVQPQVYDNKVEDLIEALLTNNLSPKLFMLDR